MSSGKECLTYFERLGQGGLDEEPCLLLIDLVMTPISGIRVLEDLHARNSPLKCGVVMMSGLTDIKAIQQGYQLGAHTFLVKPLKCEDILQAVNALKPLRVESKSEGYVIATGSAAESGVRPVGISLSV